MVSSRIGTVIMGHLKGNELYTDTFVQRHNARLRGAFLAMTLPTSVRSVINNFHFMDNLAYPEISKMIKDKVLPGTQQGAQERSTYIPSVGCTITVDGQLAKVN